MGITLIRIKIMPTSPDVNLDEIKNRAKKIVEKHKGKRIIFEEEPIAFGLKCIMLNFEQEEGEDSSVEKIENEINKILNVNSVETIDIRRAFG